MDVDDYERALLRRRMWLSGLGSGALIALLALSVLALPAAFLLAAFEPPSTGITTVVGGGGFVSISGAVALYREHLRARHLLAQLPSAGAPSSPG